jgi:hypothetical protein
LANGGFEQHSRQESEGIKPQMDDGRALRAARRGESELNMLASWPAHRLRFSNKGFSVDVED